MDEGERRINLWNDRESVQRIVVGPMHDEAVSRWSDTIFACFRLAWRRQARGAAIEEHRAIGLSARRSRKDQDDCDGGWCCCEPSKGSAGQNFIYRRLESQRRAE